MQVFLFSPYFSSAEKRDGIASAVSGAEPELVNFLELLAEKHRMPVIFRIRDRFDELWAEENRRLEVTLTSAVELDPEVVNRFAPRSSGRPTARSSSRPAWTRTSSAAWCCRSATWSWTRACAAGWKD